MKLKKSLSKGLVLGIIIANLPLDSFANSPKNSSYGKISQTKIREELQKFEKVTTSIEKDTWIRDLASIPTERYCFTSAVVDGKIYCIGGYNGSYLNTVEVYDPETDSWEAKTPMPTKRNNLTSIVVDGKIYCIGGYDYYSPYRNLNTVEVYDPETDSWETKTSMPTKRSALISAVVDGKIYCIGGYNGSYLNTVEVYDPTTDSWETKTSMPTKRATLVSEVVDEKIYCIGGYNGSSHLNIVEVYDPTTDSWETKTPMPTNRNNLTSVVVDEKIYCIGGSNSLDKYLNIVEEYDSINDSWETKAPMPTKRRNLTSSVVDGKIYCIGGYDGSSYLNIVEAYIAIGVSLDEQATSAVSNAESTGELIDVDIARDLVNQLPEGDLKEELQNRLDTILLNISLDRENATRNLDVYIKSENSLHMALSTNNINFEDYSGVDEIEKEGAINIIINSSLPYELNAYMMDEMYNNDKSQKIDVDRLNIRDALNTTNTDYKDFTAVNTKLTLNDSCDAGNGIKHTIDLKLNGNEAYPADIYKTTIKFEAQQK